MLRSRQPPLEPVELHAADVVARAVGRTLLLWPTAVVRPLPPSVTCAEHLDGMARLSGVYDSMVSVGQLGTATDLTRLVRLLRGHLAPASVLHFCEPTIASDDPTTAPPHDVTGTLWANGLTVFECRRYRARHRLSTYEYCWGRARLTLTR